MSEEDGKNESSVEGTIKAATGLVKAVPIYDDAIQPAAKQVGKTLETLAKTVNMVMAPLSSLVWGYEQVREFVETRVTEKLESTPEEEIVQPPPNVAGPALESLKYTGAIEELRELYANLLASSMDSKTTNNTHPSFVEIIKQLSSSDAKLLGAFSYTDAEPAVRIRNMREDKKGGRDEIRCFTLLGEKTGCGANHSLGTSLDNLSRLGLIKIPDSYELIREGTYDPLLENPFVKSVTSNIDATDGRKSQIEKTSILVTELGRRFINTCVIDHRASRTNAL